MFKHKAHKKAYENVGKLLKQSFGRGFAPHPEKPVYVGTQGSCLVQVVVHPWGSDDAVVSVGSCCVMDIGELPYELLKFLLEENYKFRFGAFSIDGDGDIVFEHTIAAAKLDAEEMEASVRAILSTADEYDDRIVREYGGVTGKEKLMRQAREAGIIA